MACERWNGRTGTTLVLAAAIVLVGAIWSISYRLDADPASTASTVPVQLAVAPSSTTAAVVPRATDTALKQEVDPALASRILAAARLPGGQVREVKVAGDHGQIACGKIASREGGAYSDFIWVADLGRIAINDGTSGDYAQLALLCNGQGMPGF